MSYYRNCLLLIAISVGMVSGLPAELERLRYNNPGLVVDLGAGLWATPAPCDANGDDAPDLVVICHDKPYQGSYLFENPADRQGGRMPVLKAGRRLGAGKDNPMPSYIDGKLHVLTPGFEYPDFLRSGLDNGVKRSFPRTAHTGPLQTTNAKFKIRETQWRYLDFNGDGMVDLVNGVADWTDYGWDNAYNSNGIWTNGPLRGYVYVLRNTQSTGDPAYGPPQLLRAGDQPLEVFGRVSPNFADFDRDGDLDLICGEFLDGFTYFENIGTRTHPRYATGNRLRNADGAPLHMDLEMIVPVAFDWDRDGDLDLVVGDEDGRVALIENTGELDANRAPIFMPPRYFEQQADELKCGALATPFVFDWDGDGDQDLISGNTAGYIEFFENLSGPNVANPKWARPKRLEAGGHTFRVMAGTNGSIQGPAEAKWGYTTLNVADWDGDGLPDIIYNSILGRIEWLKNIGTRAQPKLAGPRPIDVAWTNPPPALAWGWVRPNGNALLTQWRTTPLVYDFNGDGLPDLAVLDTEGYLAYFERSQRDGTLILLPPKRAFVDDNETPLQLTKGRAGASGRRKLCITDWNGDGKFDLLLNSANADLLQQVAARDGKWFFKRSGSLARQNIEGHDVSPAVCDFDGDNVPDFIGGAEDGHFYFLRNPRSRAGK